MIWKQSTRHTALAALTLVATLALAGPARAANPDFDAVSWTPLLCDTPNLTVASSPAAVNLVGNATYPPTYYAYDASNLYFRYRVDRDPSGGGGFASYVWTALMQAPAGNPFQYQYQVSLNGKDDTIAIWANTVASDVNFSPNFNDDAEVELFKQPYDQLGGSVGNTSPLARSQATGDGSNFTGDADYFVDFAIPVSVLVSEGVIADWSELGDALFFPATSTSPSTYNKGYLNCPFLPQTQLAISKTVEPAAVPANATTALAFTITVVNTSAYPAKGVVIDDIALPAYLTNVTAEVSIDPDLTFTVESVNPLLVKVPVLRSGRTVTIVLSADAAPSCGPDFENIATTHATNVMASSGSVTLVTHTPELCDGADNDCNGQADDGGNALCDDADACNGSETCGGAAGCQPGTQPDCDDGNVCTADACDALAGCVHPPVADGSACDDGDACTQSDGCQTGGCVGANPVVCSASDQCHVAGACDPATGVCSNPAAIDGAACSDGDACTQSDGCQAGGCVGTNPVVCSASDQCHTAGTCDPATGTCSNPAAIDGAACSDGDACTQSDGCQAGSCVGSNPVVCSALDQCHTAGTCDPATGTCSDPAAADGTACSDSDACTQSDACQAGSCVGTNPVVCSALDQCHVAGTCDPATGICSDPAADDGTACSDSDACTQSDTCEAGSCVGANPVVCSALDQCHAAGTCDPATGACSDPAATDGTVCSDGDACTQSDSCQAGGCVGSNPVVCSALDQCHVAGTCDPATGACSDPEAADGTVCSDGDACTDEDICLAGACEPGAIVPSCIPPVEECGNCLDDDGDGLVDAEDPDCCAEPMALGLKRFALRVPTAKVHSHRLRVKMRAAFLPADFDPMTQDTSLQIADADGQIYCHTIEAQNWKHPRRRIYRFKDKARTFAGGLGRGKFVMKKKGGIAFATAGKKMQLRSTAGGEVVVTLRIGNQCAQTQMTLRSNRKGFVFP